MVENERWRQIEKLIHLNGGKLVGKTRLQKTVFLIQEVGINFEYDFEYHYYGPYSEGVDDDAKWAEFLGGVRSEARPGFHQIPYTEFKLAENACALERGPDDDHIERALVILAKYPAVVLELAATLQFLKRNGYEQDAESELCLRKPGKASGERIEKAKKLIGDLGALAGAR